jgi:NADPH:quinone reductase-like Zn-dependent oxidoreductase
VVGLQLLHSRIWPANEGRVPSAPCTLAGSFPEAPYGALAEKSLVRTNQCVELPDGLDDVTAAAIANPGMSAWAALVERASLQHGETVLVNGATGSAEVPRGAARQILRRGQGHRHRTQ